MVNVFRHYLSHPWMSGKETKHHLLPKRWLQGLCLAFICLSFSTTQADEAETPLSAADIMLKVDQRDTGSSEISTSTLTLIDSRDRRRNRELKMFRLDQGDVEKSIIYFLSPADVQGTAYMTFDWEEENKDNDSWLYLPALQQVRRLAAADESGAFMGSDFSYTDINGLEYRDFTYEMASESEEVNGHDCWVIISTPVDDSVIKKTGYKRLKSWVRKDIYMTVRSQIDLERGNRVKYFNADNIEEIDGIWTAKTLQMVTTRNNERQHSSVLQFHEVQYNRDVDASQFDTQAMQRGL